jgi:hypothetical protein
MDNIPQQPEQPEQPEQPGQADLILHHPAAMTTQELRAELIDRFHFNPDLDQQNQFLSPELNRRRLVEILIRLRSNQEPVLPPGWANPVAWPVNVAPIEDDLMERDDILYELSGNYPLNVETLDRYPHHILVQLLQEFRLNGFDQERYDAITSRVTGGRKRKSKQRRLNKRRSYRK